MSKSIRILLCILILSSVPALGQIPIGGTTVGGPTLTAISPTSVAVGSPDFILKVAGTNFRSGATSVLWNGMALATAYVSTTQLTAKVPSTFLTVAATVQISVRVSTNLGGSTSKPLLFAIKPTDTSTTADSITSSSSSTTNLAMAASLPQGVVGQTYKAPLVSGGKAPYALNIVSGGLPGGLSFDASTGMLVGVPKIAASYTFAVTIKDVAAVMVSKTYSILIVSSTSSQSSIEEMRSPLAIATTSLPTGIVGTAYNATLSASGGATPYTWDITSGALPAGLALAPATGVISGTPTVVAVYSFTARVRDAALNSAVYTYSMSIGVSDGQNTALPH